MGKKRENKDFDLIVIGSGPGGGVAASIAAGLGKKVAIVEGSIIGGECPNIGCVPTKSLVHAAQIFEDSQNAAKYGIKIPTIDIDYSKVKAWKDLAVHRTGTYEGKEAYEAQGVEVILGRADFVSRHQITVDDQLYSASKFLIATGTKNFIPPIEGLSEAGYMTYREAMSLTELPESIFVIGGGAIGCEYANLFAIFGSKVSIAEFDKHLLPKEDAENGNLLAEIFKQRYSVDVHVSTRVVKVEPFGDKKKVHYQTFGRTNIKVVDQVMVATGKLANTDLNLSKAGVEFNDRSIPTNKLMQTNIKHIYAAGDVTGPYMFTHTAAYQSKLAVNNMFNRQKIYANYRAVPRNVFVNPEIASVGIGELEAKKLYKGYRVGFTGINAVGRSNTEDYFDGFVKIIANKDGQVLGGSIAAPRAGEMIHEITLAIQANINVDVMANTIHAFPTWSEAVRIAASKT